MLARAEMFRARPAKALTWCEEALATAARLDDVEAIADLMVTRSWALGVLRRTRESIAELQGALGLARENGQVQVELRAINNLGTILATYEPRRAADLLREGIALAERIGDADNRDKLSFAGLVAIMAGDWIWAGEVIEARLRDDLPMLSWITLASGRAMLLAWRGQEREADAVLSEIRRRTAGGTFQDAYGLHATEVWLGLARDDAAAVRDAADLLIAAGEEGGDPLEGIAYRGIAAAMADDLEAVRRAVARLAQEPARFAAVEAWQQLLARSVAAREGRLRDAASLFVVGLEGLHRTGNELAAAIAALEVVGQLGTGEPVGAEAAEQVRQFAEKNAAPVFAMLLDRRLAGGPARSGGSATGSSTPSPPPVQAGTPQNILTTS